MIEEIRDYSLIENLLKEYKDNYIISNNDYTHVLVYKKDNKYIGFLIYQLLYETCEIIDLFMLKEYRKNGYSTMLFEEMLKNKDIKKITLEVNINNEPAINLYKKLGFNIVSERKGYYEGVSAYLMYKEV